MANFQSVDKIIMIEGSASPRQTGSEAGLTLFDLGNGVRASYRHPDAIRPKGAVLVATYNGAPSPQPADGMHKLDSRRNAIITGISRDLSRGVSFTVGQQEIRIRVLDVKKII